MALPIWPSSLPYRPTRDPYVVSQPYVPPAAMEVEDGPDIMRAWGNSNWSKVAYEFELTHTQFDTFDAFVRTTLARGTKRFTMPVGRPGTPDPWPNKTVYIDKGAFQAKPWGGRRIKASFTLVVQGW